MRLRWIGSAVEAERPSDEASEEAVESEAHPGEQRSAARPRSSTRKDKVAQAQRSALQCDTARLEKVRDRQRDRGRAEPLVCACSLVRRLAMMHAPQLLEGQAAALRPGKEPHSAQSPGAPQLEEEREGERGREWKRRAKSESASDRNPTA